jgi:branched-chain amino acid transport system ATP-binding protein
VAIARGLAANPKILAVDEPCLGLAEAVAKRVYDVLGQIHAAGTTLIIVEEAPRRALTLCNRRVEVRNGMALNFRGDTVLPGDTPDPDGPYPPGSAA